MTTPAIKTVKVTAEDHRKLKIMAAQNGERVYQTVARLLKTVPRNGTNKDKK